MAEWIPDTLPDLGIAFTTKLVRIVNRSGGARVLGDVLAFDIKRKHVLTTNCKMGAEGSCWVNCVLPEVVAAGGLGGQAYAPHCLLAEDIGDGREGLAFIWGVGLIARVNALGAALGDPMAIDVDGATDLEAGAGNLNAASRVIARAMGSIVGAGKIPVLFNGLHGWAKV